MENEKIREIIIKCIGNNDSYWIQPIEEIVNEIIELPDGAENSVANLLSNVKDYTSKQLFDIQKCVVKVCNELNIELDYSRNQGKTLGLPYNIPFIKRKIDTSNICPICGSRLMREMPTGRYFICNKCNKKYINDNGNVGDEATDITDNNPNIIK